MTKISINQINDKLIHNLFIDVSKANRAFEPRSYFRRDSGRYSLVYKSNPLFNLWMITF